MMSLPFPSDTTSLLVPVHLDAWVVSSQNQEQLAWYYPDYDRLKSFKSVIPEAFDISDASKPDPGIHLHWALPDALTHGMARTDGAPIEFPLVPNRWLVARFNTPEKAAWQCKLWVVESDYVSPIIGTTAHDLSGSNVMELTLQAPGATEMLSAGTRLQIITHDTTATATVVTANDVKPGDLTIAIQPFSFSSVLHMGSSIRQIASSEFLDPTHPTTINVTAGQPTSFNVHKASIGKSYTIEAWEARSSSDAGPLFLQAVGPGNVSFAAYVPFVKDVFSFTDTDLPAEGTGLFAYTYLVVGWYSDPDQGDPLRGVTTFLPEMWSNLQAWQNQTPAQRFQTLLGALHWSVQGDPGTSPPATSLYHGLCVGVQWPYTTPGNADIKQDNVQVALGNTTLDALAAMIQAQAQKQAQEDPKDKDAWLAAGQTLSELIQAAMYDLLDDYDLPGGATLIEQQLQQSWFGTKPGGTLWEVITNIPQVPGQPAYSLTLSILQQEALTTQLAALNKSQHDLDQSQRQLQSLQAELYRIWLKVGMAGSYIGWGVQPTTVPPWPDLKGYLNSTLYPTLVAQVWNQLRAVNQAQSLLPDPLNEAAANQWANKNWSFPANDNHMVTLASLGLKLKSVGMPRFWHPNDPVLLVSGLNRAQKHGEDGRYNSDGTLTCRLPGQTITGITIAGQPTIDVAILQARGMNLNPYKLYTMIPGIATLVHEAFFADATNAAVMAKTVGGDEKAIGTAISDLLQQKPGLNQWVGVPPAPFALSQWKQAWAPLFLEWSLTYFPTGSGHGPGQQFSLQDWQFDGKQYTWKGSGFDLNNTLSYKGRTLLTAQAAQLFQRKIQQYLKNKPQLDSAQLEQLLTQVANWDILSQSLSGFTNQLITLLSQETFPPPQNNPLRTFTSFDGRLDASPTDVSTLIGEHYQAMPMVEGMGADVNYFHPVRAGFAQFQQLQVIDAFGQTFSISFPNTPQGFEPLLGASLSIPDSLARNLPAGAFQLLPHIIQATRLDFRFLANDSSGQESMLSGNHNAICGWLLPNHLDHALAVYDANGILLGELLPLPQPDNWRPRPGNPGANPPPQRVSDIPNAVLQAVVSSISSLSSRFFDDLLNTIDETIWMVDPLGERKDQFLSVLIGRPLAVVQAQLQLGLLGQPLDNQLWNAMLPAQKPYSWQRDIGNVGEIPFPVRLGSLELRDDGLIGYYFSDSKSYDTFYTVHRPDTISLDNHYLRPIVQPASAGETARYQGDIYLKVQGDSATVTLLLDPRGSVHAYTGILPVVKEALAAHIVEDFIKQLKTTFQVGPVISGAQTLRMPKPAEQHGTWTWIQQVAPPTNWTEETIVDTHGNARLAEDPLQLREGWLQLSAIDDPGLSLRLARDVSTSDPSLRESEGTMQPSLTYTTTTNPFPLQASPDKGNLISAQLTIVATNDSGSDQVLQGIIIQLPIGTDATQVTSDTPDIVPLAPTGWKLTQISYPTGFAQYNYQPGTDSDAMIATNQSLVFIFNNIMVNRVSGTFKIEVTEGSNNCQLPDCPLQPLYVTKFPYGWGQVFFWVEPANIPKGGSTTLNWNGPEGATYTIEYYSPQHGIIQIPGQGEPPLANKGRYPAKNNSPLVLSQTTVFTLNVVETISGQLYHSQEQKTVTIEARNLAIDSFKAVPDYVPPGYPVQLQWKTHWATTWVLHPNEVDLPVALPDSQGYQVQAGYIVKPTSNENYTLEIQDAEKNQLSRSTPVIVDPDILTKALEVHYIGVMGQMGDQGAVGEPSSWLTNGGPGGTGGIGGTGGPGPDLTISISLYPPGPDAWLIQVIIVNANDVSEPKTYLLTPEAHLTVQTIGGTGGTGGTGGPGGPGGQPIHQGDSIFYPCGGTGGLGGPGGQGNDGGHINITCPNDLVAQAQKQLTFQSLGGSAGEGGHGGAPGITMSGGQCPFVPGGQGGPGKPGNPGTIQWNPA